MSINKAKNKKKKTKKKVKYRNVFIALIIIGLIFTFIFYLSSLSISNIYVNGNYYVKEQEIIDYSKLIVNQTSAFTSSYKIRNNLKKHPLIKNAKIIKKLLTKVYIEVEENIPLFYDTSSEKTVLYDGTTTEEKFIVPSVINYIPDTVYNEFLDKMRFINFETLQLVSEIKYDPNEVDEERFLLYMVDGNYIYINISKFEIINNYLDIVKKFGNKKGILYLDSGEYFKILEE